MCYCIVTARSLLWTLLSVVASLAMLSAIVTPTWLISASTEETTDNVTTLFNPSVGIYNRCIRLNNRQHCAAFAVDGLATPSELFPSSWKCTLVFLCIGLAFMTITVGMALLGFCVQSICRKSIFTISGALQSVAGIFYILGLVIYPFGWGSDRVQRLCGKDSMAFYMGDCSLGISFYFCICGIALTYVCAVLSIQAEVATSSDKVQFQIHQGRSLICTP